MKDRLFLKYATREKDKGKKHVKSTAVDQNLKD
jgi:hypothetical protein